MAATTGLGRLDQVEHGAQRRLRRRLAELGDVGARDEGAAGTGEHDGLHGRVGPRLEKPS